MIEANIERLWEQLMAFIEEGRVIPVIGPELLMLDIDGKPALLYDYLAEQLAKRLGIKSEADDTLNTVACRYLAQGGQREDMYPVLKRALAELSQVKPPETLVKLAEIRPLKLFVTTCFDPYLVRTLNQVRYRGKDSTQVLEFYPGSGKDLPEEMEYLAGTTVFHLFGKLTAAPDYAVTDEDILEFMHALQSADTRPKLLFDALVGQGLMIIGCQLFDWLGRFFVRLGNRHRLIISKEKTDFLVGDQIRKEINLAEFLLHFSSRTKIFPMQSIEFVNELYQRWTAMHPAGVDDGEHFDTAARALPVDKAEPVELVAEPDAREPMRGGAVFLSYAHEDEEAVIAIKHALETAGIEVWFDRNTNALRVGDNFKARIKTNIEQCALFVPIISRHTLTQERRFFRFEWKYAQECADFYPESRRFIMPLAIDDTPPDDPNLDEYIRELHWERLQNGQCGAAFLTELKQLQRAYRRNSE
ncbi:toll/interleukin-1 receptor domain-containing protein [Methylomonas rivi]|uniref:Toll/interleukin-1 receptor domain-containing protein n=1 Tax=Methylomonas rivi TaxID=2952226 RepID=A0ABT1U020_9GAMM|nr:toll/interleukin-1 receptor domain-containing protein [Methylomonas sp. WSC-6]MCQ8127154.1 toll/interleukin-1 receptor domain-containing protein [Methylomonas sp. WSC-6]